MKILLADDHDLIREGIKQLLSSYPDDIEIVESNNYPDTQEMALNHFDLDLIIMDLFMPGASNTQGVAVIREAAPCVPLIVLSSSEEPSDMKNALESGANGYVPKSSSNKILFNAINLVLAGGIYVPLEALNSEQATPEKNYAKGAELTNRQIEVLQLMAQGKSNKEIARSMNISEHTVKSHVSMIFGHLMVSNRTQAVINAQQAGLLN